MLDSLISQEGLEYKLNKSLSQPSQSQSEIGSPKKAQPKKQNRFPKRSLINILLIILTSIEVVVIVQSQVYLHCDLVRSFLNFYADMEVYPELFQGNSFYINIDDIQQLQEHINYIVKTINSSDVESLVDMNFNESKITIEVQYRPWLVDTFNQTVFPVDTYSGIVEPFDSSNLTSIQMFLLHTRYFQIVVRNLKIENDGLEENYTHRVTYGYYTSQIVVNYEFQISNTLTSSIDIDRPQANFLIFLRVFYLFILFLALLSLYFNASYIRKVLKEFYTSLQKHAHVPQPSIPSFNSETDFTKEQIKEIHVSIQANIEVRHITINNLKWSDYFNIIDFDVIFSVISNSFQIVGNFYLLFGRQHEIIVGIGCLFAWMTIFRVLHRYKKIILMYELIKMSIMRVAQFLVSFFIIFTGYVFLGMCLFSKVVHFCSMSSAVTTLAAMMAGDSIAEITFDCATQRSRMLVIIYIFTYIILFMHAIHNTLISILKEYFLMKKIEIIKYQKLKKGEEESTYLIQLPSKTQAELNQLRLKLSQDVEMEFFLIKRRQKRKQFQHKVKNLLWILENLLLRQKWENFDQDLHRHPEYLAILEKRAKIIQDILILRRIERIEQEARGFKNDKLNQS